MAVVSVFIFFANWKKLTRMEKILNATVGAIGIFLAILAPMQNGWHTELSAALDRNSNAEKLQLRKKIAILEQDQSRQSAEAKVLWSETINAKMNAEIAKKENDKLRKKVVPRSFTTDQQKELSKALAETPKCHIEIDCINGDAESCGYAQSIAEMMKQAGFDVTVSDPITFSNRPGPQLGIEMIVHRTKYPLIAVVLQQIFKNWKKEFPAIPSNDSNMAGRLRISVGVKPPV